MPDAEVIRLLKSIDIITLKPDTYLFTVSLHIVLKVYKIEGGVTGTLYAGIISFIIYWNRVSFSFL